MKTFWLRWLYDSNPKKTWGIPLGFALSLGFLLILNLFFLGQDPPVPAASDSIAEEVPGSHEASSAANINSADERLPEKPKPELWASRIVETQPGQWQLNKRSTAYQQLDLPHVVAVSRGKRIVFPLASTQPNRFQYAIEGESRMVFSRFDSTKKTNHLSFDRSRKYRYALQIASLDETKAHLALALAAKLTEAGYYAYLYRSANDQPVDGVDVYNYKLRIGYFASENELGELSARLKTEFPNEPLIKEKFWPVLPNFEEVDQELVDFRVQRNKPWIINLGAFGVLENGLTALTRSVPYFDFLYLAQIERKNKLLYVLKGGYFSGRTSSFTALETLREKTSVAFKGASSSLLRYKITSDSEQ